MFKKNWVRNWQDGWQMKGQADKGIEQKIHISPFLRHLRRFFYIPLCLAVFLGCHTVPPLPQANFKEPGWNVKEGQAVWCRKKNEPELAGEFLLATRDDRAFVQFTKTPFPLLTAQKNAHSWELEIPTENRRYSGPGAPPKRIIWLQLPGLLAGQPPPKGWSWEFSGNHWHLANSRTGETLDGYFLQ
jgi:hypothetical protein